ncbi:MAG TPA: histidinol dehydrogenase [Bacteroidales bacterium]|nr:histidinol dehydrogenase [Bacteroidales bacterium]
MKIYRNPDKKEWPELLRRPLQDIRSLFPKVRKILDDVKNRGDEALFEYTEKFDKVSLVKLEMEYDEIMIAADRISDELKQAIHLAAGNIEKFHSIQKSITKRIEVQPGVICWQQSVPIEKIGLYVPGGTAPLFSTVLMLAIPARIAGCSEIILCTPPDKTGGINPAILYAAKITGVSKVFRLGGVQAIGAMAYGTESVPKVYKIFGPGNQYVTAAKQLIAQGDAAIDMPAGPSEVAVIADSSAIPAFVASDLLSQAEHGIDSQVILVTNHEKTLKDVRDELEKQLPLLPRKEIAGKALENSRIFLLKDLDEMIEMINDYAPEHLIISTENAETVAERIKNAGSVFIGNYSPESAGDYASGTNHTLPTYGHAKAYNGVNLDDYVKKITFQKITREGLRKIGPAIEIMAEAENLFAHKNAVQIRLKQPQQL